MNTHLKILHALREGQREKQDPVCAALEVEDDETLLRWYFLNFRAGDRENPRGLRLTHTGLKVMSTFFDPYVITLPEGYRLSIPHLLYLDRKTTLPWHILENKLSLFEADLAFKAKLVGDIDLLIASFA